MASWSLTVHGAAGGYLATLDSFASLDMALPANDVGALTLSLPVLYPLAYFQKDGRIIVDRRVAGITTSSTWLIRRVQQTLATNGEERIGVTAMDPRHILRRRIVPLAGQATKTGPADDLMKAVVREQFTTATDMDRNLTSDLFSVAADVSLAPSITIEFANRMVLDVLRDIAAAAAQAGTYLAFDVVPDGDGFQFQTFTTAWGDDKRGAVLLSAEMGTLAGVAVVQDWTDEATAVYAAGRGEGNAAITAVATDAARIALSPYGRIERYASASNAATLAAVTGAANAELQAARPREQFSAVLVEQPGMRYGVDVNRGDLVRAEHAGTRYDCRVEPVHLTVDEGGREGVDVQLRNIA